jgi:hypothetical protein
MARRPPLYIGKSRAMRSRVLQHFIATASWTPRVRRIEWQRTAGELGALLREAELVKALDPVCNRQLRRPGRLCGFAFDGKRLRLADAEEIDADTLPFVYGVWRSRHAALQALHVAADEHRLCLQTLGFDVKKQGNCLRYQLGRCAGVCAGKESIHVHHARVATALARLKNADWPHRGALGVIEAATSIYPGYARRVEVTGTEGTIVIEDDLVIRTDLRSSSASAAAPAAATESAASPVVSDASAHQRIIEDFIRAIESGTRIACDAREGRRSVAVVQAIYEAARTGAAVAPR